VFQNAELSEIIMDINDLRKKGRKEKKETHRIANHLPPTAKPHFKEQARERSTMTQYHL
jgi:hypothetical protein